MSTSFNMYPTLTPELFEKLGYAPGELELLYKEGYEHFPLSLENKNGDDFGFCAELRDPRCEWYPEKYNLLLRKTITVTVLSGFQSCLISQRKIISVHCYMLLEQMNHE